MEIRQLSTQADLEHYDAWVRAHPQGTLWQSLSWKRYQDALRRKTHIYAVYQEGTIMASALVLSDYTVMNLSTWDLPRGPLWSDELSAMSDKQMEFLSILTSEARKDRCFLLTLSPSIALKAHSSQLKASSRHEQPEATRIVDLTLPDEELLKQMHQKGRYNIKVAEKSGVRVERSGDAAAFAKMLHATAARDGFSAAPARHYETFLKHLDGSFLLLAYKSDELLAMSDEEKGSSSQSSKLKAQSLPIAGLMGVIWNGIGIYYYGASDYEQRALMAPYLLQWEAMRHCKASGCTRYDLLGVAPPDAPEDHPWQGISRFKEKFGGEVVVYPPESQIVLRKLAHAGLRLKRKVMG